MCHADRQRRGVDGDRVGAGGEVGERVVAGLPVGLRRRSGCRSESRSRTSTPAMPSPEESMIPSPSGRRSRVADGAEWLVAEVGSRDVPRAKGHRRLVVERGIGVDGLRLGGAGSVRGDDPHRVVTCGSVSEGVLPGAIGRGDQDRRSSRAIRRRRHRGRVRRRLGRCSRCRRGRPCRRSCRGVGIRSRRRSRRRRWPRSTVVLPSIVASRSAVPVVLPATTWCRPRLDRSPPEGR